MTNHKAEALDLIDSEYVQGSFNGRRDASLMLSEAQVHATLYLAEQQRLSNQIAYVSLLEFQYAESEKYPTGTTRGRKRKASSDTSLCWARFAKG